MINFGHSIITDCLCAWAVLTYHILKTLFKGLILNYLCSDFSVCSHGLLQFMQWIIWWNLPALWLLHWEPELLQQRGVQNSLSRWPGMGLWAWSVYFYVPNMPRWVAKVKPLCTFFHNLFKCYKYDILKFGITYWFHWRYCQIKCHLWLGQVSLKFGSNIDLI